MSTIPVILAGGSGSRLWPLSRESYPKQFLRLVGDRSLLQETVMRVKLLQDVYPPFLICNEIHYFLCVDQLAEINQTKVEFIIEPIGRNTAPAITLAAMFVIDAVDKDAIMLVMPSDHVIKDAVAFTKATESAINIAKEGKLVTFGIVPDEPRTGYGYIKAEKRFKDSCYYVDAFIEKPNKETAVKFLQAKCYYWNSGIFVFKASEYLKELRQYAPDIYEAAHETYLKSLKNEGYLHLDKSSFENCRSQSIDYAVMEKTQQAVMIPLSAGWSDVGCWNSVSEINLSDENDNVIIGNVHSQSTSGCYLRSEERFLSTVGIKDVVVINTKDSVLVAHKDYSQQVKELVEQLKQQCNQIVSTNPKAYHSWGYKEAIVSSDSFQVFHLMLRPNAKLSLQFDNNAVKHLLVITGTAVIVCNNNSYSLKKGQSFDIKNGVKYQLANVAEEELYLIKIEII